MNRWAFSLRYIKHAGLLAVALASAFVAVLMQCGNVYKSVPVVPMPGMIFMRGLPRQSSFYIDATPVTVSEFRRFIVAEHYITEAERFGNAAVFDIKTGKWFLKQGANWLYPLGINDSTDRESHPVTQVSWNDAQAYCRWAGKRLPTIAEFEYAAKGGDENYKHKYAWGDSIVSCGKYQVNAWQGAFPRINTVADGYLYTAPVGKSGRNSAGLSDMGGNVWQWVEDWHPSRQNEKAMSGGSFLCDPDVCHGFIIGRLSSSTPETSAMHVGFRCVKSIAE